MVIFTNENFKKIFVGTSKNITISVGCIGFKIIGRLVKEYLHEFIGGVGSHNQCQCWSMK